MCVCWVVVVVESVAVFDMIWCPQQGTDRELQQVCALKQLACIGCGSCFCIWGGMCYVLSGWYLTHMHVHILSSKLQNHILKKITFPPVHVCVLPPFQCTHHTTYTYPHYVWHSTHELSVSTQGAKCAIKGWYMCCVWLYFCVCKGIMVVGRRYGGGV